MAETDQLTKAVRGLTIAVWVMTVLTAAQFAFAFWGWFQPQSFSSVDYPSSSDPVAGMTPEQIQQDNDFSAFPPEQKIERASVILVTEYRNDGDRQKAIITEIVKKMPETRFYYNVGDEFHDLSHLASDHSRGDGQVAFLTGNPARMNISYSYDNHRIGGLGHMTIAKLRELAQSK